MAWLGAEGAWERAEGRAHTLSPGMLVTVLDHEVQVWFWSTRLTRLAVAGLRWGGPRETSEPSLSSKVRGGWLACLIVSNYQPPLTCLEALCTMDCGSPCRLGAQGVSVGAWRLKSSTEESGH